MENTPEGLRQEAITQINQASSLVELEQVRVAFLGKKGKVTACLKGLGQLSPEERPKVGEQINQVKSVIQSEIETVKEKLNAKAMADELASQTIDVTLPGLGQKPGQYHPVSQTRDYIVSFFTGLGFESVEGPEIEDEYHNFEALNIPEIHPARDMHDTFYFDSGLLLRTHTSPVQVREMKERSLPLRLIAPGRVYRCDSDVTHTPMFHQLEGLYIDEKVTFVQLRQTLQAFLRYFFQKEVAIRFRPSYFPFTEPSAEVDVQCVQCGGKGCRSCKHTGWLEVMGCGMVHPNVLAEGGVDSTKYSGYAFGLGLDRLAMLRYGIDDLRLMFEGDLRFLTQF